MVLDGVRCVSYIQLRTMSKGTCPPMYVEFDIPDVIQHAGSFQSYWPKSIFIQSPSNRYQITAVTSTYVRLVEAALVEYQLGATRLKEFYGTHSSGNLWALRTSMYHFETCISSMNRATNCFRRLRNDRWQDPLAQMLRADKANFATEQGNQRFLAIRNAIHHLEEMVMDGRIVAGQPFALSADGQEVQHPTEPNQTIKTIDKLVLGSHEIRFSEIATCLIEMAAFAKKMADYLPSNSAGSVTTSPVMKS